MRRCVLCRRWIIGRVHHWRGSENGWLPICAEGKGCQQPSPRTVTIPEADT